MVSVFDAEAAHKRAPVAVFAPTVALLSRPKSPGAVGAIFGVTSERSEASDASVVVVNAKLIDDARPKTRFVSRRHTVTCEVEEVIGNRFTAIYWDDDRGARRVRFRVDAVAEEDRPFLEERAEFYWSVGDEVREDGRKATTSLISFRRLSRLESERWHTASRRAEEAAMDLGWALVDCPEVAESFNRRNG